MHLEVTPKEPRTPPDTGPREWQGTCKLLAGSNLRIVSPFPGTFHHESVEL